MPSAAGERTGVLIVRAWCEGTPPALRARLTLLRDVGHPEQEVSVVTTIEDACGAVRAWLESLVEERG